MLIRNDDPCCGFLRGIACGVFRQGGRKPEFRARKEICHQPIPIRILGLQGQSSAESNAFPSLAGRPVGTS
jgi:hypothetical protein